MNVDAMRRKFQLLGPLLNERTRRLVAAAEAKTLGRGGIARVERASGVSRSTIVRGIRELANPPGVDSSRIRRPGGGRKRLTVKDPTLEADLNQLVEPTTRGEPDSPLLWTCKSVRHLAEQLQAQGHRVGKGTVDTLLHEKGYSLQANSKTREGAGHPDRNAQFEYINQEVKRFQAGGSPVISVDTKKKELVGDFKNGGREWQPKGQPEKVKVHDFQDRQLGKAIPFGVLDLTRNEGWVSVGIDHDTASFAVRTIRRWWDQMGRRAYPKAHSLLITADSGGSNASKSWLWKAELQRLADERKLSITVCHFPPGTSKWNKIEHQLFSFISKNWRGRPLRTLAVMVSLIAATRTGAGLMVRCHVDTGSYPKGRKLSKKEIAALNIDRHTFHGDWNYTIHPTRKVEAQ